MSTYKEDTIVSVSTALSNSAISIVRVSGSDAIEKVNQIFRGANLLNKASHTITYGHIINKETQEDIDEVLVSIFKAPKSYTTEDTVEINCHGGIYVTNKVLEQVLLTGCKIAGRGEFTKRAFLNGRIDLTKAEAVMDMIIANSDKSLHLANSGLRGDIKVKVDNMRSKIFNIISQILVNIDYPEYDDVTELIANAITPEVKAIKNEVKEALDKAIQVKKVKDGIDTVIIGKPNVGKSSLLNMLLNEQKAIVTNIPGTTRDIVEGKINLNGITLNLIDTAGVRKTDDVIEQIGVKKSVDKISQADLILFVLDASHNLDSEDLYLQDLVKDKNVLYIYNKNDLEVVLPKDITDKGILINTSDAKYINDIEKAIAKIIKINDITSSLDGVITNERQIEKLNEAYNYLSEAYNECINDTFIDMIELPLKESWTALGEITGEVSNEDLLDEMFSKFCLGK